MIAAVRQIARRSTPQAALFALLAAATPATASVSIYVTPEALAERAPWIVEATVVAGGTGYDDETGQLATYVTLDVEHVLRGRLPGPTIVLRELGGQFGGWAHETDASPHYQIGERVVAFLELADDGSLRTSGLFFGKYAVDGDGGWAERDLAGRGTIRHRPLDAVERMPLADLRSLVASTALAPEPASARQPAHSRPTRSRAGAPALPLATPPEFGRLRWGADRRSVEIGSRTLDRQDGSYADALPGLETAAVPVAPRFASADASAPARWAEIDQGGTLLVDIDPRDNPLGDDDAAVLQIERAMSAWTDVPESRVTIKTGNPSLEFGAASPALAYSGTNVVLFDDPFSNISDPSPNCSGVLAIGGYWRTSTPTSTVHGIAFRGAAQLYVIFNNDFECVLSEPNDLAEIATHELGHGIGLGHSSVPDAIMRSSAYRFRGPRLGDDDADAAHCFYPHQLTLNAPDGGESWVSGAIEEIRWGSTLELGPDDGVVDLEYSIDGGASWIAIDGGQPNDGSYFWEVPAVETDEARVRVSRSSRTGSSSPPFPSRCSGDASDGSFEITIQLPSAGSVPRGSADDGGLTVERNGWGGLDLDWGASCSPDAEDYAVYSGSLDALRQGVWDHAPIVCSTGGLTTAETTLGSGNLYFLVAPLAAAGEGRLGRGAGATWRPASASACAEREKVEACE
ncbi:MAG TPA: matrixin family metalloprotease [Candidatus Polarisedimenticolaceae bacterium]|nr:matrixin family metalloprotease [Candidatus Polarisedimenticolaceae bacterium]